MPWTKADEQQLRELQSRKQQTIQANMGELLKVLQDAGVINAPATAAKLIEVANEARKALKPFDLGN